MNPADVVGDAYGPHRIGFGLYDRVGRRNDDTELEAVAETLGHALGPVEWNGGSGRAWVSDDRHTMMALTSTSGIS
jgi:hypothetical protein